MDALVHKFPLHFILHMKLDVSHLSLNICELRCVLCVLCFVCNGVWRVVSLKIAGEVSQANMASVYLV